MTEDRQLMTLAVIPLRGMTIMPDTVIHFDLSREMSSRAVKQAMVMGGRLFLTAQKDAGVEQPGGDDIYQIGTIAVVKQITKLPNNILRVLVEGKKRGHIIELCTENKRFLEAKVEIAEETNVDCGSQSEIDLLEAAEAEAMLRQIKEYFAVFAAHYPKLGKNAVERYAQMDDLGSLLDQIAMNLPARLRSSSDFN